MKAILFYNYVNNINGALVDVIEYYLAILEHNKEIKLYILNCNNKFKKDLFDLIEDRYVVDDLDYKENIIEININNLLKFKFDRVLITDYGTIFKVKGLINIEDKNSKVIIVSDLHTDKSEYMINKNLYPNGCVTYYGEMPFVYKDIEYKHKFLFDRFKKIDKYDNAIFLHSPENDDYSFIKDYKWLIKDKKIIYKTGKHKNNLFSLFDTFWYFHADKWFDPRPRLMHECYFYDREIIYINKPICKDGSYYRHLDLNINGLKERYLNKYDEVVSIMIGD